MSYTKPHDCAEMMAMFAGRLAFPARLAFLSPR
jgi:hypothetical protein